MRQAGGPSRVLDLLTIAVALGAAVIAVAVVMTATEVTRGVASISSEPFRDVEIRVVPGAPAASGIAGKLARGERVTVLLLGYGGVGHDGAYLSDSLMVASLDSREGIGTLISIPRDLWVSIPKGKYSPGFMAKVNEAFAVGASKGDRDEGLRLADETVTQLLGVEVDRTIAVDFRAFRTVVDALGGIDIDVERSFVASYPRNDDPDIDDTWMAVSFSRGRQHMDGETALRFARARYSDGPEGSDFARVARQQQIMLAAKERLASGVSLPRLLGLLAGLRDDVRTDLSLADMQALAEFARTYNKARTVRVALTPLNVLQSGYTPQTGYVLVPRTDGWSEVHAYVRRALEHPASFTETPSVLVRVSSARSSVGEAAIRRLRALGFDPRLELYSGADPDRTQVTDDGTAAESAEFLSDYFAADFLAAYSGGLRVVLGREWSPPREIGAPRDAASETSSQSAAKP